MNKHIRVAVLFVVLQLVSSMVSPPLLLAGEVFLDEEFTSLNRWEPWAFSNIKRYSQYTLTSLDGVSCLKAVSNNSASALRLKEWFNVYDFPKLAWRFRVSNIYRKGDSSSKDGDDYPVRLYVMFRYDPENATLGERIQYELARAVNGEYPPHSSLNYIWASKDNAADIITSPFTSRAMMLPVARGRKQVGIWVEHRTNLVKDYQAAFGRNPPAMATIAVMSDADNTGESATAYIDSIRIFSK